MSNHLKNQTSPYLLLHAENPVDWYPWGDEAFKKAADEDKPVFLSIGYSTCHWCHVMARESFENGQIAELLNKHFVAIKVDKEERPDIDSIYMAVCQAFTGSGGWPTSIFMTSRQKPFFAGTYFPLTAQYGVIGFRQLLEIVHEKWETERDELLRYADEIIRVLNDTQGKPERADEEIIKRAVGLYKNSYDSKFGGFGGAPKFPSPHNLLFLLTHYEKTGDRQCLEIAENTLEKMYRGGISDHIGGGFCRYSTDRRFLVPHFEKMLYDNAMLILAFSRAHSITKKAFYLAAAEKTARYILREMTSPEGGFYSAQDADAGGEEGKYYVFVPSEITAIFGNERGEAFNKHYNITENGNFEGKSIPNLLQNETADEEVESVLEKVYEYRKSRAGLRTDDKILTAWNSLMIAAMCAICRESGNTAYLEAAKKAQEFIEDKLCEGDTLFVSYRGGSRGERGFLDDYAFYIYALLALYGVTLEKKYLERATVLCRKTLSDFCDREQGGFYLYGENGEKLILRPKETYDGAIPGGNSVMAYNLVRLSHLDEDEELEKAARRQLDFLYSRAKDYPAGYAMFLLALSDYFDPPAVITVVPKNKENIDALILNAPENSILRVVNPGNEYRLKDGKTTFYVCRGHRCMPAENDLNKCSDDGNTFNK